ncbi:MAG: sensor histidine kinase [Pedobacter sp.]|nr:sensor histidine kinase [Pedobacter sp.]MDQ8053239.1 sensor histidine kinase [Pedobacter sp.]
MTDIISITLENEMDLVLAHKRSMKVAEKIGLTVATQTAFATAVAEVARTVIDHTNMGNLQLAISGSHPRFSLNAVIVFGPIAELKKDDEGFFYAQKLVPEFSFETRDGSSVIEMAMGIPRSLRMDALKIAALKAFFLTEEPLNAYEEIKNRKNFLSKVTSEQELEIKHEKFINEKKSEFISIASHEIKTPITILKAYTQMLVKNHDNFDPKINSIVDKLDQQTTKLTTLVQQLMDVSQMENGTMTYNREDMAFNAFMKDIVDVLTQAHATHPIVLNLGADTHVSIDKLRMEQVITNLLGNAAKYSPPGTSINVDTKIENNFAIVSVSDEGIGMSPETLGLIFEKFYRNKEVMTTHPGLGMGLYITSKIVVDHGGKIWAESTDGKGSIFHISIPRK